MLTDDVCLRAPVSGLIAKTDRAFEVVPTCSALTYRKSALGCATKIPGINSDKEGLGALVNEPSGLIWKALSSVLVVVYRNLESRVIVTSGIDPSYSPGAGEPGTELSAPPGYTANP